ncbi:MULTISPECIES: caspase family protein [unclassified Mesorhizobium]|uniref:caspase family protein n=1 Tax=unclassified Mesorhizobium TaxID=325217 RepID=UPI00112C8CA9|nr:MULTISPECIES: caspase family protein [unclassified Mesorhizobium]MBZ9701628.1 caspase family protein [Mesorhizobium sp. CO1-1-3]MBZ9949238.1 caspase family protein [Mesorhizobium sp. BR1-1-11]TPI99566.1 caspase family protein [Mesorhizobium sp. B2-8-1]
MRILIAWPALALLLAAGPGHAGGKDAFYTTDIPDSFTELTAKNQAQAPVSLYSESFALLIGEVNYRQLKGHTNWPTLENVPAEIGKLTKVLEQHHFKVEVHFDVTSADIDTVVDDFMRRRATVPESRILVYVSGHGVADPNLGTPSGYILPVDAPPKDTEPPELLYASALQLNLFQGWARAPHPRHMLVVLDACFSGSVLGLRDDLSAQLVNEDEAPSKPPLPVPVTPTKESAVGAESSDWVFYPNGPRRFGRQFLASGHSDEVTPSRSILTSLLIGILDGAIVDDQVNRDHWTTATELGPWIAQNAEKYSVKPMPAHPIFGSLLDDKFAEGDFTFARVERADLPLIVPDDESKAWAKVIATPFPHFGMSIERDYANLLANVQFAKSDADRASDRVAQLRLQPFSTSQKIQLDLAVRDADLARANADKLRHNADSIKNVLTEASAKEDALAALAAKANTPADVKLTDKEQTELQAIIDSMSAADSQIRHTARTGLSEFLAKYPNDKRGNLLTSLLSRLATKSYRFQLGMAVAVATQKEPISTRDVPYGKANLLAALNVATDPTLQDWLKRAIAKFQS